jgi:hypothetical protein
MSAVFAAVGTRETPACFFGGRAGLRDAIGDSGAIDRDVASGL